MQSYRFPNPRNFCVNFNKWVEIIGDNLHTMDPNEVYFKKRVCSVHFTENDRSPGTNRLKCNVVPTLHMPVSSSNPDAKLPDTPESAAVSMPTVDLESCGIRSSNDVVSSTINIQKPVLKPIDLDLSGIQELDDDLINLIGMYMFLN